MPGRDRNSRQARERARLYQERQAFHERLQRRRTRDNLTAGIAGALLLAAVIAGQTAYFVAGPGAPTPTPAPTTTTPTPGSTTPTPTPTATG